MDTKTIDSAFFEYEHRRRNEERKLMLKAITRQYILIGSVIIGLLTFTAVLLALDKDAIAIEILKAFAFFLLGVSMGSGLQHRSYVEHREKH